MYMKTTLGAACILALMAGGAMAKTYKLASNVSPDSTAGEMIAEFTETVGERTDGRVNIKVFANGVLRPLAPHQDSI